MVFAKIFNYLSLSYIVEKVAKIRVHVIPNSKENRVEGYNTWKNAVVIRIKAPPVEGKANREVEKFLSKFFGCDVEIVSGRKSKDKIILVKGMEEKEVYDRIGRL